MLQGMWRGSSRWVAGKNFFRSPSRAPGRVVVVVDLCYPIKVGHLGRLAASAAASGIAGCGAPRENGYRSTHSGQKPV